MFESIALLAYLKIENIKQTNQRGKKTTKRIKIENTNSMQRATKREGMPFL